jgi:hypothetical protein
MASQIPPGLHVDEIFLDTTYCIPRHTFPAQVCVYVCVCLCVCVHVCLYVCLGSDTLYPRMECEEKNSSTDPREAASCRHADLHVMRVC